ncbi:MAG: hypothetical protein JW993_09630 [Sedimentisphaerales bacterium]|nr:hypothetical protein [Sedimentisphaerales bacterium]
MNDRNVDVVERRLADMLEKERREVLVYVVFTVALTPAFVAIVALIVTGVVGYTFLNEGSAFDLKPLTFYTTVNLFLAYVITSVAFGYGRGAMQTRFDGTCLAGVLVFLVLLLATYTTSTLERPPLLLALAHAVGGFAVLGLMGHSFYMDRVAEGPERAPNRFTRLLAVSGFIIAAYGELVCNAWLWRPPRGDEVRLGAWVLSRLACEMSGPAGDDPALDLVVRLLRYLQLVQETDARLMLTAKGLDFVRPVAHTGL